MPNHTDTEYWYILNRDEYLIPQVYVEHIIRVRMHREFLNAPYPISLPARVDYVTYPIKITFTKITERNSKFNFSANHIILYNLQPEDLTHLKLLGINLSQELRPEYLMAFNELSDSVSSHVIINAENVQDLVLP